MFPIPAEYSFHHTMPQPTGKRGTDFLQCWELDYNPSDLPASMGILGDCSEKLSPESLCGVVDRMTRKPVFRPSLSHTHQEVALVKPLLNISHLDSPVRVAINWVQLDSREQEEPDT